MLCLGSMSACAGKPAPSVPASAATVQCKVDCVSVSKAFIKQHAELYEEAIKMRAALKFCEDKR
jgi:hypothetical protein